MKKHFVTFAMTLLMTTLLVFVGCGGDKSGGGAGLSTDTTSLFSLLPADSTGVFSIDFGKLAKMKFFNEMIEDAKNKPDEDAVFKNYDDFVNTTGINPKKDIHGMAIALTSQLGPNLAQKVNFVAVLNVDYDKSKIVAALKTKNEKVIEDSYNGMAFYKFTDKKGEESGFALINDKTLAFGPPAELYKVMDLSKGSGKSLADGPLKPYFDKLDQGSIVSFLMAFPQEFKKVQDAAMFKFDLSKAEAVIGNAGYSGNAWEGSVVLISNNKDGNDQLVATLNGLKAMAGMAGPEAVEVADNIKLKSDAVSVTLSFSISEALVEKLKAAAEKKKQGMTQ